MIQHVVSIWLIVQTSDWRLHTLRLFLLGVVLELLYKFVAVPSVTVGEITPTVVTFF